MPEKMLLRGENYYILGKGSRKKTEKQGSASNKKCDIPARLNAYGEIVRIRKGEERGYRSEKLQKRLGSGPGGGDRRGVTGSTKASCTRRGKIGVRGEKRTILATYC